VVNPLVSEVEKTRKMVPDILEQVEATNHEIAGVRELVPGILTEIQNTNVTVDKAVIEIRETREAIPGIMDRADRLVLSAGEAGKEAGKGAVSGVIGGIIAAPFGVVGNLGSRITGLSDSELGQVLTEEDVEILQDTLIDLAENAKVGETVTWKNKKSSNSGKITLLDKYVQNDQECREIKVETFVKGEEPRIRTVKGCQQPDGAWVEEEDSREARQAG
jgi:surface antigen